MAPEEKNEQKKEYKEISMKFSKNLAKSFTGKDGKEYYSKSAYPLCQRAPEQYTMRQYFHIIEDGSPSRRESRHRLEVGISNISDTSMYQKRKHTEEGKNHPNSCYHHKGIMTTKAVLGLTS